MERLRVIMSYFKKFKKEHMKVRGLVKGLVQSKYYFQFINIAEKKFNKYYEHYSNMMPEPEAKRESLEKVILDILEESNSRRP
jgi:hypothetical protein